MDAKKELRLAIKERLSRMSENDRRVESQVIVREIKKLLGDEPRVIGAYFPFQDEPDIKPLLSDLLETGWTISIPRVERQGVMRYVRILSLGDVTRNQTMHIPEPMMSSPLMDETLLQDTLVPARAFSYEKDRLGRGNGGYDRWIEEQRKRNPHTRFIGLCFDCQLLQSVPREPHDQAVDIVVTSSKVIVLKNN